MADDAALYHFVSEYSFRGDRRAVWTALAEVDRATTWWRGLRLVEILQESAADDGIGRVYRSVIRAPIGYTFDFSAQITAVEPLRRTELRTWGELVGRGRFHLEDAPEGGVRLTFTWIVRPGKRWVALLTPVARPVFTWNHHVLMDRFGRGVAQASGTELLDSRQRALTPPRSS